MVIVSLRDLKLKDLVQLLSRFTTRVYYFKNWRMLTPLSPSQTHLHLLTMNILQKSEPEFLNCFTTGSTVVNHSNVCNFTSVVLVFLKYNLSGGFCLAPNQEATHLINQLLWDNIQIRILLLLSLKIHLLFKFEEKRRFFGSVWLLELCFQKVLNFQVGFIKSTEYFLA